MSDTAARTALAVALLASDRDLQRLALTWPAVERDLKDSALLVAWSRVAGVPLSVARRKTVVLLQNRICLPGGLVADEARRICETLATQALRDATRSRR